MTARRFVDLHTHSNASDGALEPAEVVRLADQARLAAVAMTDHDTIDALAQARQAAASFPELRLVSGIEIAANFPHGTMHLLGLGIDPDSPSLQDLLRTLQAARAERNPKILARLAELGMNLEWEDVMAIARPGPDEGRIVGRLHIAEAMRRRGYVSDTQQAFHRWIGVDRPAYVDKDRLSPADAIRGIRQAGGLAILAHPVHLNCANRLQLERVVRELVHHGLQGIEVYHSDHDDVHTRIYLDLARHLGLEVSGGSDFHGSAKPTVQLGRPRVPIAALGEGIRRILRLNKSG